MRHVITIVVGVAMALWSLTMVMIAACPIFFRRGGREWHRRARGRQKQRPTRPKAGPIAWM